MGTKRLTKPTHGNSRHIEVICNYCRTTFWESPSHYKKKNRHYCSTICYAKDRKENWKPEEQSSWKGGITRYESHRKWVKKNPEKMAHYKATRYARKKGAEGSHTLEEWNSLKEKFNNKCAICKENKPLTKDHIIPLSENGTDYIGNIQPLCRNCNSKKWKFIYENKDLLT